MNKETFPNLELFSQAHVSIGCSQIAFSTVVLPKDDRTNSFQEERLGLPYWTIILAICVVGRRIQMSGHSDCGIFNNLWASSTFTWVQAGHCVCCLSIATRQSGDNIHIIPSSLWTIHSRIPLLLRTWSNKWPFAQYQIFPQIPSHNRHVLNIHLCCRLSQEMSLNIDINKIFPVNVSECLSQIAQKITDFITELHRCESWENVPLEFSRLSIDSIIISVAFPGLDSCNSVLPSFVGIRMLKDPPEAQHRIREDIDFCALKIDDCFITNQRQTFPRIIFPMNFVQTMNFLLVIHHLRGDIEHLLQREIFIILDETWHECCRHLTVAAMNILQNIECSLTWLCNVRTFFSVCFALGLWLCSQILLRHCL